MNDALNQLTDYLHALSLRERALFLVVVCTIIFFLGDALLLGQHDSELKQIKKTQSSLQLERSDLELKIAEATSQLAQAKQVHEQTQQAIHNTEADLHNKTQRIEDKLNRLVPPTQITALLRNLLGSKDGLKVLSVNNEPVKDISITVDNNAEQGSGDETLLYEHAATIKLSGNYLQLYQYLTELEDTGWELFWDTLHYRVTDYPNAEITLRVLTISTDKHWIGL